MRRLIKQEKKRARKRPPFIPVMLGVFVLLLAIIYGLYRYLLYAYDVKTVVVEGNTHYTDEEIKNIVMEGKYGNNSLYLSHKYKKLEITDIPFVETINVQTVSKDTIRITVYEKALAGYIDYLGRYIYFDKDGIVVESSDVLTKGVPEVVGVDFDYVILHEKLPAKNEDLFKNVLEVTQLMTKYNAFAEKIYFKDDGEIVLYKDDITIKLGKQENLDIKIMNLPSILKNLEGKSGTLHMENYDEDTKRVTFDVKQETE